jgi:hypothetical protein
MRRYRIAQGGLRSMQRVPGAVQRHQCVHARLPRAMALLRRTGTQTADNPGPRISSASRRERRRAAQHPGNAKRTTRLPATFHARAMHHHVPPKTEGAGNAGRLGAPAASRAAKESTRVSHHRFAETSRHSLRDGFNAFLRALPGEPGVLSPSPAQRASVVAALTPASGCQDHTTSPSARHIARQLM